MTTAHFKIAKTLDLHEIYIATDEAILGTKQTQAGLFTCSNICLYVVLTLFSLQTGFLGVSWPLT